MKINWFCPLPPEKTDIAHYTSRILAELHNNGEIVLWTDKKVWSQELENFATVRWYDPDNLPEGDLKNADVNIYNIGNNNDFHGAIYKVSRKYPGIVIIHDVNLHYLFTCLYPEYKKSGPDQDAYVELMQRCHGYTCKQDLNKFFSDVLTWSTMSERYPLTFAAVENALGVIVHTQKALETFSNDQRCSAPVLYSPLPYPATPIHPTSRDESRVGPPYQLIIFGYLGGTYRRVQSVLEALGGMSEKSLFRLDIYGRIWDEGYIRRLIQEFGLEDIVTLHGFVEEADLDAALTNADLAFNLRYPTGGEASGSQLRIWSHGVPNLVTRVGWYADLPEDTVAFVNQEREIRDIQKQLQNFLAEPAKFAAMGKRGQEVLAVDHNPALYARQVVEFALEVTQPGSSFVLPSPPAVSVIIPTYNCDRYLQQAIESVLQQSYTDYEIIVIDDGSTDSTQQVLQPFRSRIRYTAFQNNQGVSVARNQGLEMARGKLIAFLDADDWFLPNKLAAQVAYFQAHPFLGLVDSGFEVVDAQGVWLADIEPWHEYPELNLETWLLLKPLLSSAMMFRREWLEWAGGFDTNFHYGEDVNLIFRIALMNCQADWLRQVTVCHRQPNKQSSHVREKAKYLETALLNLFAHSDLSEELRRMKDQTFYQYFVWLAWALYQTGHPLEQAKYLRKALNFTHDSQEDVISDWVSRYREFSVNYGYDFDAYNLSNVPEWKDVVFSVLNV